MCAQLNACVVDGGVVVVDTQGLTHCCFDCCWWWCCCFAFLRSFAFCFLQESLSRIFTKLDIHKDGFITNAGLREALETLGLRADPDTVDELWSSIVYNDVDGDGKINYDEFRSFALWRTENLRRTFDEIDANEDGTISAEEVQRALNKEGLDAPLSKVREILLHMDSDANGHVTFEDFRKLCVALSFSFSFSLSLFLSLSLSLSLSVCLSVRLPLAHAQHMITTPPLLTWRY